MLNDIDIVRLADTLTLAVRRTGSPAYDAPYRELLGARSLRYDETADDLVLRIGAVEDYAALTAALDERGLGLLQDEEAHLRSSQLSRWYDAIAHLTPRSVWYDGLPTTDALLADMAWPVFIKGDRQTSRHQADRAVARSAEDYERIRGLFRADPILHWQRVVVRELLPLRIVEEQAPGGLPAAFEFRTFWWRGALAGAAPYWSTGPRFQWTDAERADALAVAAEAARLVDVPFLVVDVAQDVDGRWWVIECNDGQEAGWAGCQPLAVWSRIVALERAR